MATVGHVAVGLAAGRAYQHGRPPSWTAAALWSGLALLPDADVIGFALGVRYEDPWGHRGASHSLAFAIALGLLIGLAAGRFKGPAARTAFFAGIALGSHGFLDTLTDGGLGCALLWPFDLTRYFAPWRPIPVAPIGLGMLSPYGAIVVLVELAVFSPLLLFALRRPGSRLKPVAIGALTGLWVLSVWLMSSTDPVRETIVGFVIRDRTLFAAGFSEQAFRTIERGMSEQDVRRILGAPHGEGSFYRPKDQPSPPAAETSAASLSECRSILSENGVVVRAYNPDACRALGIQPGTSLDTVHRQFGSPNEACWEYSWSPGFAVRLRMVCFNEGVVDAVIKGWALSE